MNRIKKTLATAAITAITFGSLALPAFAKPGAQVFNVYDNTQDGLQVATDPTTGQVEFNANPGGSNRLIITVHAHKAAPNCTLSVQLVRASEASNGGFDETGHIGSIQTLGELTTNGVGNGNAHFEVEVGDGTPDTATFGHIDLEDVNGTCEEADGTTVGNNEYGATFDPALDTPVTWLE